MSEVNQFYLPSREVYRQDRDRELRALSSDGEKSRLEAQKEYFRQTRKDMARLSAEGITEEDKTERMERLENRFSRLSRSIEDDKNKKIPEVKATISDSQEWLERFGGLASEVDRKRIEARLERNFIKLEVLLSKVSEYELLREFFEEGGN